MFSLIFCSLCAQKFWCVDTFLEINEFQNGTVCRKLRSKNKGPIFLLSD